jgi:hypothetical protein
MKPHPRIRKAIKWGGAAATVLLVVVWISSAWFYIALLRDGSARDVYVSVGVLGVFEWKLPAAVLPQPPPRIGLRQNALMKWKPVNADNSSFHWLMIPLWIPLLVVFTPTAIAWHLDALARGRARVGLCPECGYDRTGLAAGAVCPECGHPAA